MMKKFPSIISSGFLHMINLIFKGNKVLFDLGQTGNRQKSR